MFGNSEHNQILNYLVPTPFVLANGNAHIPLKPGTAASKEKQQPKEETKLKSDKNSPHVPSEVNVVVIPPPFTNKSSEKDHGLKNDQAPRGPLTYEGLVQLRARVSSRKSPEDEKQSAMQRDPNCSNNGISVLSQNIQPRQIQSSKINPPAVAPKPKKIPSHIAVLNHKGTTDPNADSTVHCLSTSPGSRGLMKPEKVRLEALSKLGLLKEKPSTKGCPTETHSPLLQPSSSSVQDLLQSRPCADERNQKMRNQPSHNSSVLHHRSMTDLTMASSPAGRKAATLERSGMGLGSSMCNYELSDCQSSDSSVSENHQPHSFTTVIRNNSGNIQTITTPLSTEKKQASGQSSTVPPVPHKSVHSPCLNVLKVPNMGDDRREALRKLGLLKN